MMSHRLLALVAALLVFASPSAFGHKPSDSYLTVTTDHSTQLQIRWDIALRDLELPLHLDANGDGVITWGELHMRKNDVEAYAGAHLAVQSDGKDCSLDPQSNLLVDDHTDGTYAVLELRAQCPAVPTSLRIDYSLFFDIDPTHRGLLRIDNGGSQQTAVLSPDNASQTFALSAPSRWRTFSQFLVNGVEHIWVGYDHILFLISLLLPSVLVRRGREWLPVPRLRDALLGVLAVVTAFTVSHSITLTLAAIGIIGLPSRLVESGIALSVLLAALNTVFPLVSRSVWLLAFGFGFVHGLGFANVLADLGLPSGALALALASFNIGVEIGQLSIVLLVVPVIYLLRTRRFYRPWILVGGSCVIASIATAWLISRMFDLGLG